MNVVLLPFPEEARRAARSRACSAWLLFIEHSLLRQRVTSFVTIMILFTEVVASWLASGLGMMEWEIFEGAYLSMCSLEIPSIFTFIAKISFKYLLKSRCLTVKILLKPWDNKKGQNICWDAKKSESFFKIAVFYKPLSFEKTEACWFFFLY